MGFRPKKITICFYTLGNKNADHMAFFEQHALNISFVIFLSYNNALKRSFAAE